MKKYLFILFTIAFVGISFSVDAQSTRRKKRRQTEDTAVSTRSRRSYTEEKAKSSKLIEKLNPEIKFGSIGGGSTYDYSIFSLSLKGNVGYKLTNFFSAGVGTKFAYQYVNYSNSSVSESYATYGAFGYARAKYSNFYIQGEYVFERYPGVGTSPSSNLVYPTIGGGYMNVSDGWSIGPEINFILDDSAIDTKGIYEYWINVSYRF